MERGPATHLTHLEFDRHRLEAFNLFVMKLVRWKFGKKIRAAEEKHFSGKRDGAHFRRHKTYRRMLYRLRTA